MFLSTVVLLASLAQTPAVPAPAFQSRVTLQVRTESGESAGSVASYLALRDLLGSIDPNLVPHVPPNASVTPDQVVVAVSTAGPEMLTICAFGEQRAAVENGMTLVVEHLRRIEPGRYRERRELLDRAIAALAKAERVSEEARSAQNAFVAKHGAIDPTQRLQILQSSVTNRTSELKQSEMNVAEGQARADYLRAMLARIPSTIDESVEVSNGEVRMLMAQLDDLEAQHAQMLVKNGPDHSETKMMSAKIDEVRAMLASRRFTTRKQPNPRYTDVEQRLYGLEADVAQDITRRDLLRKTIEEAEAEAARLTLIANEFSQIWRAVDGAEKLLIDARLELRSAERAGIGLSDGWFAVIAGPTLQSASR